MATSKGPTNKPEWTESRFKGDEGDLVVADFVEYSDAMQELMFSVELEMHKENLTGAIGLPFSQAKSLAEDLLEQIEFHMNPGDPRPTPECPTWCSFHRADCEGCHYGHVTVNDITLEIMLEPEWDEPRVDVGGYDWVNGGDLTDMAEALHVAERILGTAVPDVGGDCD